MRRQYARAGEILLAIYPEMGDDAATALFHGARALSRADRDDEAIRWYRRLVDAYPRSSWAPEAQYLSGWLRFNLGDYAQAIDGLEKTQRLYPRSEWARDAGWYLGLSHYLLGDDTRALPYFAQQARRSGALEGGKGRYWQGRVLQRLDRGDEASRLYRGIVADHPFSWYALLARARLGEMGQEIGPFGRTDAAPDSAPEIADRPDPKLADDELVRAVDELIEAGLGVEAAQRLRAGEPGFLKRHPRGAALATLLDRYRRAGNYSRPYMLAVVHGGSRALDTEPKGRARLWWEHAYPLAYRELVDKYRELGDNPPYYLYAIMRKESGFDPHVHSYADAIGLLQMIPPTTRRVVRHLGIEYTEDLLFDPELNVRTGSWYIGHLLAKFNGQIPFGAGAFNGGPSPIMKWLDAWGERPVDELVELAAYTQTREYMKKVTENYARYVYLYAGKVYDQPLRVDGSYVRNDLTY
jgi:soluble lytic murein transglycosylase